MNKKLFLKLLLLLSLSLIACSSKNNSSLDAINNQVANNTESPIKEDIKTASPSVEGTVKSNQQNNDVTQDTQQPVESNIETESAAEEYSCLIKEAYEEQQDYINSIDDTKVKQSIQTANSAAIFKANELLIEYPEDTELINTSLKKVLANE